MGYNDIALGLDEAQRKLSIVMKDRADNAGRKLEKSISLLNALGPQNVLERGYTYITGSAGQLLDNIDSFDSIKPGDKLKIQFHDGSGEVIK